MKGSQTCARRRSSASSVGVLAMTMAATAGAQDAQSSIVEEIVVTAQKRTENLQDVPSSISVFSDARLQQLGASSLTDYAGYIPGLSINDLGTPGQVMVTLRGIAPVGPGSVVGYYVDDTPLGPTSNYSNGREFGLDLLPYDVERIEVLRGPQGTLYGASAMGGLLKYVLREPDLSEFSARIGADASKISAGDDLGWGARAGVNVPLVSDKLGLWMSYSTQETPGYIDNAFTGVEDENEVQQEAGRAALRWQINSDASLQIGGMWQRIDAHNSAQIALTLTGVDPPTGADTYGQLRRFHPLDEQFKKDIDYYSATLEWDLDWASFTSATGYSESHTLRVQDTSQIFGALIPLATGGAIPVGYTPFQTTLDLEKTTQELRLTSPGGGRVEWMVGAFYTKEENTHLQEVFALDGARQPIAAFAPALVVASLPSNYEELAGFGSVTFKLTERFDITGGLRWAENKQEFRQITGGIPAVVGPPRNTPGTSQEDVLTYMVSPRFHINDDTMVYARVATGYRPGGPNARINEATPPSTEADELTNYEAGIKAQLADRRAVLNFSVFYIDWRDIQQTVSFGGISSIGNSGDAISQGFELETSYAFAGGLRVGANVAYTDAELKSPAAGIGATRLGNVPEWSAAAIVDYPFALSDSVEARVGGGYRYVGEQGSALAAQMNVDTSYVRPSYSVLDLNADLTHGAVTYRLFARNVTDERAYTGGSLVTDVFNNPVGIDVSVLQPRTIGVSVDVSF